MAVSEGMDVARVREIAVQLHREAHRLTDVSRTGRAQLEVLREAWAGVDSQGFGTDWAATERSVQECSGRLDGFADDLSRQAEQQDDTSSGAGGVGGPASGPGGSDGGGSGDGGAGPKEKPDPKDREGTLPSETIEGPLFAGPTEDEDGEPVSQVQPGDVEQGQIGDCWLITSMQAIAASNPDIIEDNIKPNDDGTYTVTLYEDGEPVEYVVEPDFPADDGDPQYADNPGERELWPLLYEKAMAQHMGGDWEDIVHDSPSTGIEAITGQDTHTEGTGSGFLWLDPPPSADEIRDIVHNKGQVALSSHDDPGDRPAYQGEDAVVTDHIYWVKDVKPDGTLVIINPHDPTETAHEMSYDEYRENFSHITTSQP